MAEPKKLRRHERVTMFENKERRERETETERSVKRLFETVLLLKVFPMHGLALLRLAKSSIHCTSGFSILLMKPD